MTPDATELHIGKRLYSAGWRQGSILEPSSLKFAFNKLNTDNTIRLKERAVRPRERLVVASQNCDIISNNVGEPFIEVLVCSEQRADFCDDLIQGNSSRYFVIDKENCLVAKATHRILIEKAALEHIQPGSWTSDDEDLARFSRWLARRYIRPDFPNEFVEAFQNPIRDLFISLRETNASVVSAFSRFVREVRVSKNSTDGPPFNIQVLLITLQGELTEEDADALDFVQGAISETLSTDSRVQELSFDAYTLDGLSAAQFFATDPIHLDYLTYDGDEYGDSAEPLPKA